MPDVAWRNKRKCRALSDGSSLTRSDGPDETEEVDPPAEPHEWIAGSVEQETPEPLKSSAPCSVYRFFDASGKLLYVGITTQRHARIRQHSKTKEWWPDVASATFQHFPSVDEARRAESIAIHDEKPVYNVYAPRPDEILSLEEAEYLKQNRTRRVKGVKQPPIRPSRPERQLIAPKETLDLLDKQTRKWFKMSAGEFIEAWESGEIAQDDRRLFYVMNLLGTVRVKVHGS